MYILDDGKDPDKKTWVESLKDPDMLYTPGHIKTGPEINGKACNLNSTLRALFPAGSDIGLEEVRDSSLNAEFRKSGIISRDLACMLYLLFPGDADFGLEEVAVEMQYLHAVLSITGTRSCARNAMLYVLFPAGNDIGLEELRTSNAWLERSQHFDKVNQIAEFCWSGSILSCQQ